MERLSAQEAVGRVPALRRNQVAGALFEPDAVDIDVDGLHQGYLRGFKSQGGRLVGNARVTGIEASDGAWRVTTTAGAFAAPRLVNAAGAWADEIAERAGVPRIGLTPKRRTALLIAAPDAAAGWPLVADVGSTWYCRPEAGGKLLVSPADETPVAPSDVRPEEIDIARAVARLETAMDLPVRRIEHSWAGLRTFTPDGSLAIGPDPEAQGFFWMAGQGGYGIQTAPAAARLGASLLLDRDLPAELLEHGVKPGSNAPGRFLRGPGIGR
jgi:D-arginine dehydrogenase